MGAAKVTRLTEADCQSIADMVAARLAELEPNMGLLEAAKYLDCSPSWIKKHLDEIPHSVMGGVRRQVPKFQKSKLRAFADRHSEMLRMRRAALKGIASA